MSYKLATSRPAQAVGTSDNSRRADGDGGKTAGIPSTGVRAVGAFGSQSCEIPHRHQSPGADDRPTARRRSRTSRTASHRAAQSPGSTDGLGNTSPPPGGEAARHTPDPAFRFNFSDPVNQSHPSLANDSPPVRLKKRSVCIGTWNMRGRSGPSGVPKVDTAKLIMKLEKVDLLVLTETHSADDSPPSC